MTSGNFQEDIGIKWAEDTLIRGSEVRKSKNGSESRGWKLVQILMKILWSVLN